MKRSPALQSNCVVSTVLRKEGARKLKEMKKNSVSTTHLGLPVGSDSKESACNAGDQGSIQGQEDPLEKGMQPIPEFLPGEFHGQREPGGVQSMESQRVGPD